MSNTIYRSTLLLLDIALLAIAAVLALILRENLQPELYKFVQLAPYLVATLIIAVPTFVLFGLDRTLWRFCSMPDYLRTVSAVVVCILLATATTFTINRLEDISRSVPILQIMLAIILMIGSRVAVRLWCVPKLHEIAPADLSQLAERKAVPFRPQSTVLIIGLTTVTILYLRSIADLARDKIRVGGILAHADGHAGKFVRQFPIFGTDEDLDAIIRRLSTHGVFIDKIVVTVPFQTLPRRLQEQLLQIRISPGVRVEHLVERLGLHQVEREPVAGSARMGGSTAESGERVPSFDIEALQRGLRRPFWRLKRILDVLGAALLLAVAAPLFLAVNVMVVLTIGLPAIFWQDRPGRGGRPFKLYKFRTMGPGHDSKGRALTDQERLNVVGRFLRATRLDELPQLWNILKGEMSFVGPRPLLNVDQPSEAGARLLVRPGLTGWAQVMGGRHISAGDKAVLDAWYVQNASLWRDLEIAARTIPIIFFGEQRNDEAIDAAWDDLKQAGIHREPPRLATGPSEASEADMLTARVMDDYWPAPEQARVRPRLVR